MKTNTRENKINFLKRVLKGQSNIKELHEPQLHLLMRYSSPFVYYLNPVNGNKYTDDELKDSSMCFFSMEVKPGDLENEKFLFNLIKTGIRK